MSEKPQRTTYGISKFLDERYQPYALAVGQFAFAWNEYHEEMGRIFAYLTTGNAVRSLAAWGAISSDRTKREVLLAVIEIADASFDKFPKLHSDVTWLAILGNTLEEHRNNAIHSPFTTIDNALYAGLAKVPYGSVQPSGGFNSRSSKLASHTSKKGKDLLAELHAYRDAASRYAEFASLIVRKITTEPQLSWPDRPLKLHPEKKSRNRGRRTVRE